MGKKNFSFIWMGKLLELFYFEAEAESKYNCNGNENKPPAMQVCSQLALASRKKPPMLY